MDDPESVSEGTTIPVRVLGDEFVQAQVSPEDFEELSRYAWRIAGKGYAGRNSRKLGNIYMHRFVLGLVRGDGLQADHINGNRLDNRRENLRIVTCAQNRQNVAPRNMASSYRGVRREGRGTERWVAFSHLEGRFVYLGTHTTEIDAARVASNWRQANLPFSVEERHVV